MVALAKHCVRLISVNFGGCKRRLTNGVWWHWQNIACTNVIFGGCVQLTDASVMALAEHCPHVTTIYFDNCQRVTDASMLALEERCPYLTNICRHGQSPSRSCWRCYCREHYVDFIHSSQLKLGY